MSAQNTEFYSIFEHKRALQYDISNFVNSDIS